MKNILFIGLISMLLFQCSQKEKRNSAMWTEDGVGSEAPMERETIKAKGVIAIENRKIEHYDSSGILRLTISCLYPQIAEGAAPDWEQEFNEKFANEAQKAVKDFLTTYEEEKSMYSSENPPISPERSFVQKFSVRVNTQDLLGFSIDGYFYMGGAHGMPFIQTYNFDKHTGKQILLTDIFKAGSPYLQILSKASLEQLEKQYGSDFEVEEAGLAPIPENFQNFLLKEEGFMVQFGAYQVGPYAVGMPMVLIPYPLLKGVAQPRGLLEKFVNPDS